MLRIQVNRLSNREADHVWVDDKDVCEPARLGGLRTNVCDQVPLGREPNRLVVGF